MVKLFRTLVAVVLVPVLMAASFGPTSDGVSSANVTSTFLALVGSTPLTGASSCDIVVFDHFVIPAPNLVSHAEAIVKLPHQDTLTYEFKYNGQLYAPTSIDDLGDGTLRINLDRNDIQHTGGTIYMKIRVRTASSADDFTYSSSDPNQLVSVSATTVCPA